MKSYLKPIAINVILFAPLTIYADNSLPEEVVIWGNEDRDIQVGPNSILTQVDFGAINLATTEDVVKFEPNLVIRRRFIGDSNGTMGMRGSNMFQTSRSMVFADGVPLHYLLQSRWNGAPRWTMVSASEIAQVEVLYGPFSAEYSGNAMGGVVSIETAIPQERSFHFDSSFFSQDFQAYGFNDHINGYKSFVSYGDKIGATSLYFSYNRLENESQPQSYYYGGSSSAGSATAVGGALPGNDQNGRPRLFFGDTGIVDTTTDNYKIKVGHEFGHWFALLNLAYEDRNSLTDSPNSYVRDADGNFIWSGSVEQNGQVISIPSSRLKVGELDRRSLSTGLRLKGELNDQISLEANLNRFSVLDDQNRSSGRNPNDPAFTPSGQVIDFGATGWQSAELKLKVDNFLLDDLKLITGLRHENYELNLNVFHSSDYASGSKDSLSGSSGGQTRINAAFIQTQWKGGANWELGLGLRFESWQSKQGYYDDDNPLTPEFDLVRVPKRDSEQWSPKFSFTYYPADNWSLRYSLAKAYRFPIVEELFSQYEAYNAVSIANTGLRPENGLHHNLSIERKLRKGYLKVNLFAENIEDVIESQLTILDGGTSLRTFIPIDEVETRGLEFIANLDDFMTDNLNIRFNLSYTDASIVKNAPNPALEGKVFPRMPEWRGNILANYQLNEQWQVGVNLQYASDSFGSLDNADTEDQVYGAQDGYTRIGLRSTYDFNNGASLGFGIDNLSNEIAYVAHPWPGRTYFMNLSYDY